MDLVSILIIAAVTISGLVMIIGPITELKGKILFLEAKCAPKTSGRWGMRLMVLSLVLLFGGLLLRSVFPSGVVTPFVVSGYVLWFVGGAVALIRNEVIKALGHESEVTIKEEGKVDRRGTAYLNS